MSLDKILIKEIENANSKTEKSFVPEVKHLQATVWVAVRVCVTTVCMLVFKKISRMMSDQPMEINS